MWLRESNIQETLSFYWLLRQHDKHMKPTNMLERLNEEFKRRTRVVRIFPNSENKVAAPPQGDLASAGLEKAGFANQTGSRDVGVSDRHGSVRNKRSS